MANMKSAAKRARQSLRRQSVNRHISGNMRAAVKIAHTVTTGDQSKASLDAAVKAIYKAASAGVIHKRQAARRVSRLMKQAHQRQAKAPAK